MGCSNISTEEKLLKKSLTEYNNIATVKKYDSELTEDFGVVCFMELKNDKFLVALQSDKVVIYDKKTYESIFEIVLDYYSVNSILKLKNGNYLFGGDYGKIEILSIDEDNNSYKVLNSYNYSYNITKIIEKNEQLIVSNYKEILFFNLNVNNELSIIKKYKDHLTQIDIFNIFIIENLLLSFAYGQQDPKNNEIIIYNLDNNKIVFKQSNASVMPWNQTVYQFNSNILAITGNECEISLFDIKSFKILAKITDLDFFYSVICLRNKIFCGSNSGEIYEFEFNPQTNDLKYINKIKIHESSIFSISKTLSGELVTTSRDGKIKFFK